ncbi:hypothetical protein N9444_09975 [Gammaproteobacteria bacterium]|nr:hypothetical protein [Gammaproteobacteria bacterium]MDG2236760.1 hypothetical protein [Arenicellales bacterium]
MSTRSPQINGKVERSQRPEREEFYRLLSRKRDVGLPNILDK